MSESKLHAEGERALTLEEARERIVALLPGIAITPVRYSDYITGWQEAKRPILALLARVAAPAPPAAGGLDEEAIVAAIGRRMSYYISDKDWREAPWRDVAKAFAAAAVEAARPAPLPLPRDFIECEPAGAAPGPEPSDLKFCPTCNGLGHLSTACPTCQDGFVAADHVAPAAAVEPLAAAVTDLLAACGIPANLCGVTSTFTDESAAELLRFAAKLARKAAPSAEREGLDGLILQELRAMAKQHALGAWGKPGHRLEYGPLSTWIHIAEQKVAAALRARPGEGT
jgi:hypothetical protein